MISLIILLLIMSGVEVGLLSKGEHDKLACTYATILLHEENKKFHPAIFKNF